MYHCKDIESNSTVMQLKNYLFCTYDQDVRPTENHRNITTVRFGLIPTHIDVFDQEAIIQIHGWTQYVWRDKHLTWDPAQYDGIQLLHLMNYEMWTPDIMVHSGGNLSPTTDMPYTHCWLDSTGLVVCHPSTVYSTTCVGERTWWPYDALNCTVHFGSWSHADNEISFTFIYPWNSNITMRKYVQNHEWDVVRFYVEQHTVLSKFGVNFNTTLLSYNIVLKRRASMLHTAYVIPAIVLMVMTLLTLWLEPKSTERMLIANLNLVCHLICIEDIHWRVRYNGANIPKLFVFYEFSLMLALLSLMLTSILRHLQEMTTKAPG
ncbi:hypothetical protein KM043_017766 [Ampulex compressa]|nr:hypothetical protein KM043_017766 [Ampulex compressa]